MNKSIYDISEEYLNIVAELEESEGELTPELEERLAINKEDFIAKATAYVHIIRMTESETSFIDTEIERLNDLKAGRLNKIERLKNTLKNAVILFGEDGKSGNKKVDLLIAKLWTTNRQSVEIADEEKFIANTNNIKYCTASIKTLPYEEARQVQTLASQYGINIDIGNINISKTLIKEDIEKEIEVNGASLITKASLTIK
jgi:hypothetical protein